VAFFEKLFKKQAGETQQPGWETQSYTGFDSKANAPGDSGAPELRVEPGVLMEVLGSEVPLPEADYDFPGEYAQRFDGVAPGRGEASGGWYVSKPEVTLQSSDADAAPGEDSSKWLLGGQMPTGGSMGEAADAGVEARFEISQPDLQIGSFTELQGITTKVDVVDYAESDQDESLTQSPPNRPNSDFSGQYVVTGVEHSSTEPPPQAAPSGEWEHQYELASGKVAQTDYDFEKSPGTGETSTVYGYDGAKGDYALIPAAEEPVIPPGSLEYPNLTIYVPEADQVTPETPAGSQGFGVVTLGDAEQASAIGGGLRSDGELVQAAPGGGSDDLTQAGTDPATPHEVTVHGWDPKEKKAIIGEAEEDAAAAPGLAAADEQTAEEGITKMDVLTWNTKVEEDDGPNPLVDLTSESPGLTPIHENHTFEAALPDDGDADGDEVPDDDL
jgi:hypothetical protein